MESRSKVPDEATGEVIWFVDPFAVDVRVQEKSRKAPPEADVLNMAISLHVHGQRRAVECRRDEAGRWFLEHGLVRTLAARLIRTGFKYTDPETNAEGRVKDRRFTLKVVVACGTTGDMA